MKQRGKMLNVWGFLFLTTEKGKRPVSGSGTDWAGLGWVSGKGSAPPQGAGPAQSSRRVWAALPRMLRGTEGSAGTGAG